MDTEQENFERCYECEGLGDNYFYDSETGNWELACLDCPFNGMDEED